MTDHTKGRPTLYKGIRMRSRLEADYASTLGEHGGVWEYEPECFAADGIQWLPDFRITYAREPEPVVWYHEVKPMGLFNSWDGMPTLVEGVDKILRQMSVAWDSEPGARLQLAFCSYKRPWPDFTLVGTPEAPWMCRDGLTPNSMSLIWPGMGQGGALPPAPESGRRHASAL